VKAGKITITVKYFFQIAADMKSGPAKIMKTDFILMLNELGSFLG